MPNRPVVPVEFDHLVVGGGLSGLLLANALLAAPSSGRLRIAVVDPRPPSEHPVTYAYWARRPTVLDEWTIGSWSELHLVGHDRRTRPVDLDGWRYTAVDWRRGRSDLLRRLHSDGRVSVLPLEADAIRDGEQSAAVRAGGRWLTGRWVYDSRPPSLDALASGLGTGRSRSGVAMLQSFRGRWVRSDRDTLDPSAATLLDFSADDGDDLGFAYVLPTTARAAMVMAVRMGASVDLPDPLPAIERAMGTARWEGAAEESGLTPLVVPPPPRRLGRRVLAIGRRGGRVRPSTGYAVARILIDTAAIRRSLERHGHPFDIPPDPPWQRRLDRIWLRALERERAGLEPAFLALFSRASVDSVLRFLDGDARPQDVLDVVRALPPTPFLRALV